MDTAGHKEQSPFSGTSESRKKAGLLHFGGFTLDLQRHGLYRKGDRLHLTPKPFETLAFLVEHRGRTIGKQKLLDAVWKEAFVTEDTLVKAIREIRRVLEDDKENPRFVQTVPGEGYRFIADVTEANQEIEEHLIREHGLAATSARHVAADAEAGEHVSSDDSAGSPRIVEPAKQQPQDRPEHKPLEPANPEPADTLRRTVARLTEDEPKRHFRWWAAGVLGLTILVTAVGLYMFPRRDKAIGQGINSLAILPFTNASGDVSAQYLSDGITESLINRFSRLSQLRVTARATVFRYKGQDQDIQAIGRKLNVRAVLTGRVLLRGDSLNIQADLVEVSDGSQLWGEQYHRKIGEILNVQEEIASQISKKLQLQLRPQELKQLTKPDTQDTEAYQLYLKGVFFWNKRTEEGLRKAIDHFRLATERDPNYALAHALLSDCYGLLGSGEWLSPREVSQKARAAAIRALEIDDTLAEAHVRLAASKLYDEWDWTGAEREYQQAIALNPTNATAHQRYSTYLIAMGRTEESLVEMRRALELDPVSLIINTGLGWHLYFARRYDQAIEQYRKTLELDPNFVLAYFHLGEAYVQKARYREAFAAFDKAMAAYKGRAIAVLGHALATAGHRDKARQVLSQLKELAKQTYICPYNFAVVHAGLGDKDRALLWLERAYEERSIRLVFLQRDPVFDSLRSDLRFQQLLHRLGFVDRSLKLK